tara:strand:+ start:20686 stop:21210 length:525 start_codon:yes stop_codon:yes gene_type:complete
MSDRTQKTPIPLLRLARQSDAGEIARMSREYVEAGLPWTWREARVLSHIQAPESTVLVASMEARLAGFAIMEFGDTVAGLCLLAIHPWCRRKGLATRLIQWHERSAITAGIERIHIEVREDNVSARNLYSALGYQHVKRIPGYYSGRETAVQVERELRPMFSGARVPNWQLGVS